MGKLKNIVLSVTLWSCLSPAALAAEVIDINSNTLDDPRIVLEELKVKVNRSFNQMEKDLARASTDLGSTGLTGPEARKILNTLYSGKKYVVDAVAVDPNGIMVSIEPEAFQDSEGEDISNQAHFIELLETKKPILSNVFLSKEGVNTIVFQYPVFSQNDEFLGAVSLLMRYEDLFSPYVVPVVAAGPLDVWIIQKDGLTLYDPDKEEIGRNVFEDPIYKPFPSYVALCRRIAVEESGFGSYNFLNKGLGSPVNKDAAWDTIGICGAQWRMVVVQERRTIGGGASEY